MNTGKTQKLTAKVVAGFHKTATYKDRLWDSEFSGLFVRRLKTTTSWGVAYRNDLGQLREFTIGRYPSMTSTMARGVAQQKLAAIQTGCDPLAEKEQAKQNAIREQQQTLRSYLDGPYSLYQQRKKDGKQSLQRISGHFEEWLDRPMSSLTRADLEYWQATKEQSGLSYNTLHRNYGALRTLLNHAAEKGVIEGNPLQGLKLEKPFLTEAELSKAGQERRYLEEREIEALFLGIERYSEEKRQQRRNSRQHGKSNLPDLDVVRFPDYVEPWLLTAFYTGFRHGDIFGMQWQHVNLKFRTIRKVIEKTAHHNPKLQTFPICDELAEVLTDWHKQLGKPDKGYVFQSDRTGGRMDKDAMQRPWARVRKYGGLPEELVIYTLRHNFASQLVMAGCDLFTVSKLMTHTDIKTTIKHYAHLQPSRSRDYVQQFAQTMKRGQKTKKAAVTDIHKKEPE